VGRDSDVPHLAVGEELHPGGLQLEPHQHGQGDADESRHHREDDVEAADILVVGREEPARQEARRVVVVGIVPVMGVVRGVRHGALPVRPP
jgi:hypothetical protein